MCTAPGADGQLEVGCPLGTRLAHRSEGHSAFLLQPPLPVPGLRGLVWEKTCHPRTSLETQTHTPTCDPGQLAPVLQGPGGHRTEAEGKAQVLPGRC